MYKIKHLAMLSHFICQRMGSKELTDIKHDTVMGCHSLRYEAPEKHTGYCLGQLLYLLPDDKSEKKNSVGTTEGVLHDAGNSVDVVLFDHLQDG